MKNDLITTFFSTTYTLSQARVRLRLLRDYLMNYFFKNDKSAPKDPWLAQLGDDFYNEFSANNTYQKLQKIERAIAATDPLVLSVAFAMPDWEVDKLGLWFRQNVGGLVLYDIRFDPNLIAGCSLSWHGVFKDYSLRALINQQKDKIFADLKSFKK